MSVDMQEIKAMALACDPAKCADEAEEDRRLSELYSELTPEAVLTLIEEAEKERRWSRFMVQVSNQWHDRYQACLGQLRDAFVERDKLKAENAELQAKCEALGRYVSIGRRQKSQYFRAVKWFLANTNIDPKQVPGPVYHTLVHVVKTLAEKAKRSVEVANG
ncbi:hypothetical protein [Pseudomonas sp. NBRC 111139]|uniref:hypothetical protein n=1 Tax=Pseudomonas sp. NBRC 111139 TaxID=1661054 RepID=UPI0008636922|nr:hypothetical protein [Pseudomonas sp. NBRC 111139]